MLKCIYEMVAIFCKFLFTTLLPYNALNFTVKALITFRHLHLCLLVLNFLFDEQRNLYELMFLYVNICISKNAKPEHCTSRLSGVDYIVLQHFNKKVFCYHKIHFRQEETLFHEMQFLNIAGNGKGLLGINNLVFRHLVDSKFN